MLRLPLILVALSLAVAANTQGPQLAKKISFDERAATADKVLKDLSQVAGVRFSADGTMRKEVLAISVHDVAILDLAKRIAEVSSGAWDKRPEGYVLTPDNALREKQDETHTSERVAKMKHELDSVRQVMEQQKKDEEETKEQAKAEVKSDQKGDTSPQDDADMDLYNEENNAVNNLLLQIDPAVLAAIEPNQRIVFASNPNSMQDALPQMDAFPFGKLVSDHNQLAKALRDREIRQPQTTPEGYNPLTDEMKPIEGSPAEAILVVGRASIMTGMDMMLAELKLYDPKGNLIYHKETPLDMYSSIADAANVSGVDSDKPNQKPAPEEKGTVIQFGDKEKQFIDLLAMSGPTPPKLTDELRALIFDPVTNEPLSLGTSTALKALAAEKSEQFVGDLPDSLVGGISGRAKALHVGITTTQFRDSLIRQDEVDLKEDGGWMEVLPKHPTESRKERFDRPALTALIQASQKRGAASLNDLANYALETDEPSTETLGGFYFMIAVPGGFTKALMGGEDWQTLRFYGSLREKQRLALLSGQTLSAQSLSPDQIDYLRQIAFGFGADLQVTGLAKKQIGPRLMLAGVGNPALLGDEKSFLQEPTECMPQGLPGGFAISQTSEPSSVVKLAGDSTDFFTSLLGDMGPEEFGMFRKETEHENTPGMPNLSKVVAGDRVTYHLRIQLLNNVWIERDLYEDSFTPGAPAVAYEDLPASFRDKAEKFTSSVRAEPDSASGGPTPAGGGG